MVGEPFQFQPYAPQALGARGRYAARQAFQQHAVGRGVPHAGVSCRALQQRQTAVRRPLQHETLQAPVLVAQGDFQMQHVFAVTLKTEVPWLDDPGVHRPHGHLMDFFALHPKKGIRGCSGRGLRRTGAAFPLGAGCGFRRVGDAAHGLEPGVPQGLHAPLFPDFALKELGLRTDGREGRKTAQGRGAQGLQIV